MGLFAATPPLEALKLLISDAATFGDDEEEDKVIMVNDVSRAFFEAPVKREVCVEIPDEAKEEGEGDVVGLLKMSLYGTRDAAANFQQEVRKVMVKLGFKVGRYNVSTYYHKSRKLQTLVHGDDFVTSGSRKDAAWLKGALSQRFDIKTSVVGRQEGENRETRILNRVIRVNEDG